MKLIFLRIIFGAALGYALFLLDGASTEGGTDSVLNHAFLTSVILFLGILNAIVWAAYVGEKLAEPITGMLTDGSADDGDEHRLIRILRRLDHEKRRRMTVLVCLIAGVKHPWLPTPFKIGLKNAKPGSWLETIYAKEVLRFNNTQDCIQAYSALKKHGIDPPEHENAEINVALHSLEREVKPTPDSVILPAAPVIETPQRNKRIRLSVNSEGKLTD